ncbi:ATP-binding cassette domain-containing protein [Amylibacter sp.]|nr:ATP-binding cassette domain-containing protein [Amylibacter sp.]MDC3304288.1 ATP-binding cassette domain-containing protein [Amylibacter sp.]
MVSVSLLDVIALYFFTEIISGTLESHLAIFCGMIFFLINMTFQVYSIKVLTKFSFKIVSDNFEKILKIVLKKIPSERNNDDYLTKLFCIEYFRVCERILLPSIVIITKSLTVTVILLYVITKSPILMSAFIFLLAIVYLVIFKFVKPRIKINDLLIETSMAKIVGTIELLNMFKQESHIYDINGKILNNYTDAQNGYIEASADLQKWSSVPRPVMEGIIFLSITSYIYAFTNSDLSLLLVLGMGCLKALTSIQNIYYAVATIAGNISSVNQLDSIKDLENIDPEIDYQYDSKKVVDINQMILRVDASKAKHIGVNDIFFDLSQNKKIALIGKSGIGKTTILDAICGLNKNILVTFEINGEIYQCGKSLTNNLIGYMPQVPSILPGTLRENLNWFCKAPDNHLIDYLKRMELFDLNGEVLSLDMDIQKGVSGLSGGQIQRIALIRVLLCKKSILLLDEVTSSLDPRSTQLIIELISSQSDLSVIWVTHDPLIASSLDAVINLGD